MANSSSTRESARQSSWTPCSVSSKMFSFLQQKFTQCRGKPSLFASFASIESKARRQTLENKILYLIQLWADTFMMYEDKFPHFLSTYRTLRKEGVQFPPREASTRFMLSSMGLESPMFEYLEEVSYSSKKGKPTPAPAPKPAPKPVLTEDKAILEAEREFKRFTGGIVGVVSHEKNTKNLAGVTLSPTDIETIKNYMQIIDEICVNAERVSDIKTDIALEMFKYCQAVHSRCLNIIAAKSAHGVEHQLEVLLSLSEDLDVRVKLFKNTFVDLFVNERMIAGGKVPVKEKDHGQNKNGEKPETKTTEEQKAPNKKPKVQIKPLPPPPSNPFFQFETKQEPLLDLLDSFEEKKTPTMEPQPEVKKEEGGLVTDLLGLQLDMEPADGVKQENVVEKKEEKKQVEADDFFEDLANRKPQ
eukprot:TRINITY_DN115_c0_g2_i1.p1 TRINITY_DN115_c0_g2~~TRINITY_DN115_c0_g2_i1.p1  ORF type:complete len:416 (+),score=55.69 TRINITY_DN115_c0_g2_i1:339-1586(+)